MQPFEINSYLSGADGVDATAKSLREFLLGDHAGRSHADRVSYSAAPHDPTGLIVQVLHAKLKVRFEYARYVTTDFKLISGQFIFTKKVGETETDLPIRLRIVNPNNLVMPDGKVYQLPYPHTIQPYENIVWDALTYALLGEVLDSAEEWTLAA